MTTKRQQQRNYLSFAERITLSRMLEQHVEQVEHKGEKVWVWRSPNATAEDFVRSFGDGTFNANNVLGVLRGSFVPWLGHLPKPEPAPAPEPLPNPLEATSLSGVREELIRFDRQLEKMSGQIGKLRADQNVLRRDFDNRPPVVAGPDDQAVKAIDELAGRTVKMEQTIEALLKDNLQFRSDLVKRVGEVEKYIVEAKLKIASLENNSSMKVRA